MSIKVNQELCIGCGACAATCPEGFKLNDNGKADPISQEISDCTKNAQDICPVSAISI